MQPLIKVCGLTRQEDLTLVEKLGFDFAGFIFASKSPRFLQPVKAASLTSSSIKRVGVFVDASVEEIVATMQQANLHLAQLHGLYSVSDCERIGVERVIKVFWPERYKNIQDFQHELDSYTEACSMFLCDAGTSGGGSGKPFDWSVLDKIKPLRPMMLSGGLTPALALTAWQQAGGSLAGLDVNSGVEEHPGIKNRVLLESLRANFVI